MIRRRHFKGTVRQGKEMSAVHPIDHLVLPTTGINAARERLGKLGFTVAADARHPFGTENACVFFADKTYLEPLGVASAEESETAAAAGNVFVARDQAFRFRAGNEGFNAMVFLTSDARGDDERFRKSAVSAGKMLEFSRPMRLPDGTEATGAFRLAFAADLRAPDFFAFNCERVNPLPADRRALETHANGVVGLSKLVLSAPRPDAFSAFVSIASNGAAPLPHSFGIGFQTANVMIDVLDDRGMEAFFDEPPISDDSGLRGRAIVFRVVDLSVTEAHLAANGVTYTRKNNTILVKAAPGQGALFAFEETV
jgi:hypothetical protein